MSWEWASLALALLLIIAAFTLGKEDHRPSVPKVLEVCAGKLTNVRLNVNAKQVFATLFGEGVLKVVNAKGLKLNVYIPKPGSYTLKLTLVLNKGKVKNYIIKINATTCSPTSS